MNDLKRQKTSELRKITSIKELADATQMSFRAQGNVDASKIIKDISDIPTKAKEYCKAMEYKKLTPSKLSSDEAVSLIIEAKLSKNQYNLIRWQAKEKNCDIYPAYKKVLEAKNECYPDEVFVNSDTKAEVSLQSLLNHTSKRLVQLQQDILKTLNIKGETISLILVCKWGFDGSSGHSQYKQKFNSSNTSDASVFLISFVPIKLYSNNCQNEFIVWQNLRTSSPRFCRPIKLLFSKETTELTIREKESIESEIAKLVPFEGSLGNKNFSVHFEMHFTMIDGKVANAVTSTKSTQMCYLCGATARQFNKIDEVLMRPIIRNNLQYGLSTLHAWIRFFECLLHLSYKMEIKKWQARTSEDKLNVSQSKKRIQALMRSRIGLIVDQPKPGFGSSNDGNTARRFFGDPEVVSEITNIDIRLIKKFHVILQVLSSGHDIDTKKFKTFCLDTAKLFVELYSWYSMPTTVHKILIHGAEIVQYFLVPIGQMSEEAQEARNKDIKNIVNILQEKHREQII